MNKELKLAIVCIAKNEDNYIDEWIKYHTKLGFNDVYIYQNNWRYSGDKSQYDNVYWIEFDGYIKQVESYNNFLKYYWEKYDWAAFFDVDEFLCLKNISLIEYLHKMNECYGIGVNWRLFGNNNLVFNNDYAVLNRFTKCEKQHNMHIKTILNLTKLNLFKNNIKFYDPHCISLSNIIVDVDNTNFINGPFNKTDKLYDIQLNHYFCKTTKEFQDKIKKGRADCLMMRTIDIYESHNLNNVEDLTARNFYNS